MSCKSCGGMCCVGVIDLYPKDGVCLDPFFTESVDGKRQMKIRDGRCIAYEGGCTIYKFRPTACRLFEMDGDCCKAFRSGDKKSHSCSDCCISNMSVV